MRTYLQHAEDGLLVDVLEDCARGSDEEPARHKQVHAVRQLRQASTATAAAGLVTRPAAVERTARQSAPMCQSPTGGEQGRESTCASRARRRASTMPAQAIVSALALARAFTYGGRSSSCSCSCCCCSPPAAGGAARRACGARARRARAGAAAMRAARAPAAVRAAAAIVHENWTGAGVRVGRLEWRSRGPAPECQTAGRSERAPPPSG